LSQQRLRKWWLFGMLISQGMIPGGKGVGGCVWVIYWPGCSLDVHGLVLHLIVGTPAVSQSDCDLVGRAQGRSGLAPVLGVGAHMVAVVGPAMDGPVLEDARGDGVGRAGRVAECGVVVVVEVLLLLISAPHCPAPAQKWQEGCDDLG
jgi:hypothetical protein